MRKLTEFPTSKRCCRCHQEKPVSEFYPRKDRPGQYLSECKACGVVRTTERNRSRAAQRPPKPAQTHKECGRCHQRLPIEDYPLRGDGKGRRSVCHSCKRAEQAAYRDSRRPDLRERQRAYYADNKEAVLERHRLWRAEHPDRIVEITAKSKQKHAERIHTYNSAYQKAHPDEYKAHYHARRARIKANGGTYTAAEWTALKAKYGNRCLWCGAAEGDIQANGKPVVLTPDHVVPIVRGGSNTIENIQPLCKRCNSVKSRRVRDFRPLDGHTEGSDETDACSEENDPTQGDCLPDSGVQVGP